MLLEGSFSSYTPEQRTLILPVDNADLGFFPTTKFPEKSANGIKSSLYVIVTKVLS